MNKKYSVDDAIVQMLKWRNVVIVIGAMIVFMAAGFLAKGHQRVSVEESAFAKIQVDQLNNSNQKDLIVMNPSDGIFMNTYIENLRSHRVVKEVKAEMAKAGYKTTLSKVRDATKIEPVEQTSIVKIQNTGSKVKLTKAMNRAYQQVAIKEYKRTMGHGAAEVVDTGNKTKTTATGMSRKKVLFFSGILGFILAFVVLFIKAYFDSKVRSRRYLAQRLGVQVLNQSGDQDALAQAATNLVLQAPEAATIGVLYSQELSLDAVEGLVTEIQTLGAPAAGLKVEPIAADSSAAWLALQRTNAYVVAVLQDKTSRDFVLNVLNRNELVKAKLLGAVYFEHNSR